MRQARVMGDVYLLNEKHKPMRIELAQLKPIGALSAAQIVVIDEARASLR